MAEKRFQNELFLAILGCPYYRLWVSIKSSRLYLCNQSKARSSKFLWGIKAYLCSQSDDLEFGGGGVGEEAFQALFSGLESLGNGSSLSFGNKVPVSVTES